jgi:hypothetical protein
MNQVLDRVRDDDDHVLYVDADLKWEADLVPRLLAHQVDVAAPLCWAERQQRPYDLWGTRRHGVTISPDEPWFQGVQSRGLQEVDSAACFNVMDAKWARVARFGPTNANVGWHDEIRANGGRIWLDLDARVTHP